MNEDTPSEEEPVPDASDDAPDSLGLELARFYIAGTNIPTDDLDA